MHLLWMIFMWKIKRQDYRLKIFRLLCKKMILNAFWLATVKVVSSYKQTMSRENRKIKTYQTGE